MIENPSAAILRTNGPVSYKVFSVMAIALIVSATLNVMLAHRCRTLIAAREQQLSEKLLAAGASVPPLTVRDLDGREQVISYKSTNQPTVLYVFTPPCSWCARNMDNFKTLLGKESGEYRFIALSLSENSLAEYVAKNDLKLPVYSGLSMDTKAAYKLSGTPQTIVISPEGRVLQNWMGAYVGDQKSQVEAFFHVNLPGLRELPVVDKSKAIPTPQSVN